MVLVLEILGYDSSMNLPQKSVLVVLIPVIIAFVLAMVLAALIAAFVWEWVEVIKSHFFIFYSSDNRKDKRRNYLMYEL